MYIDWILDPAYNAGMRNITGSLVEGDDFFDRPKILARLHRDLDNLGNILLVAPRRVGKTSLVMRLCHQRRSSHDRKAVYLNVEGQPNEFAFVECLIAELAKAELHPELLTRAVGVFNKLRQSFPGGIKMPGLDFSLGEVADPSLLTLRKVLESVL